MQSAAAREFGEHLEDAKISVALSDVSFRGTVGGFTFVPARRVRHAVPFAPGEAYDEGLVFAQIALRDWGHPPVTSLLPEFLAIGQAQRRATAIARIERFIRTYGPLDSTESNSDRFYRLFWQSLGTGEDGSKGFDDYTFYESIDDYVGLSRRVRAALQLGTVARGLAEPGLARSASAQLKLWRELLGKGEDYTWEDIRGGLLEYGRDPASYADPLAFARSPLMTAALGLSLDRAFERRTKLEVSFGVAPDTPQGFLTPVVLD
ncbi:MAG TPA: hypothetical protein VM490_20400, partial [Armatimonadaceae bacterium]|nr:hypothetical protein [Armatimonadaceae bacterium]